MTSNKLKIIACITMLIDHIGYILLPEVAFLRYIGRIAMPLFAFMIAEGCRHTKNRVRYFLQVLGLAAVCQLFYFGEQLISGTFDSIYLNILFTFSLSIALCFAVDDLKKAVKDKSSDRVICFLKLVGTLAVTLLFTVVGERYLPIPYYMDYGLLGVLLPVGAVLFDNKWASKICFAVFLLIYCILGFKDLPYIWYSLLSLILIFAYNGQRGKKGLKYLFYIFYPLHLAVLYGISVALG